MLYYIISDDCHNMVCGTSSNIRYARMQADDMIQFDVAVSGFSCGYKIVSERLMKEYRGFHDDCKMKYVAKYRKGLKNKDYVLAAIAEHKEKMQKAVNERYANK